VSEGRPIVLFSERSVAARAFKDLAKSYLTEFEAEQVPPAVENGKSRRGLAATLLGRGA
jgi:hypothetical protein